MSTTGFYPGTFNPWHRGHEDVLAKALKVYDKVVVAFGINKAKFKELDTPETLIELLKNAYGDRIDVIVYDSLTVTAVADYEQRTGTKITGIVRGLRNGADLQYEMNQQYWNEDLGLVAPVTYFITDRKLSHISSSAIREITKFSV